MERQWVALDPIEVKVLSALLTGYVPGVVRSGVTVVPLSVSQRETVGALRNWLREGRAQSASFQEIREAEQQFVPLQLDLK